MYVMMEIINIRGSLDSHSHDTQDQVHLLGLLREENCTDHIRIKNFFFSLARKTITIGAPPPLCWAGKKYSQHQTSIGE